jgi:anaerobic magnesium-protoporphyrin IX monomethyl ester cyclase
MIFIVPSAETSTSLGHLKQLVVHTLPFGIAALASILERDGIPVAIINDSITPVTEETIKLAAIKEPGRPIFGITSLTLQAERAIQLNDLIMNTLPEAVVIVGGIHAAALPEEFLDAGIRYVFAGEADLVISDIAKTLSQGGGIDQIPGVISKDRHGAVQRAPQPGLMDLHDLPPFPYHLFDNDLEHYDLGAVMSSRGCPYQCIFCSQRAITGIAHRTRPVEHIIREITTLTEDFGVNFVTFFDDNFLVDLSWSYELCTAIVKLGLNRHVRFMCQMRGDAVSDESLTLLAAAGFSALSFGIETGAERVAEFIRKGETVASNIAAVRLAKQRGFTVLGTFIIGFPTETALERKQTLELAMHLPLDVMRVNIAIPYPGTPLFDMTRNSLVICPGWRNFNVVSPLVTGPFHKQPLPYIPDGTTDDELRLLMVWANLKFWLRPQGLASFFFSKSTFVTRMPEYWFLKPGLMLSVIRTGLGVLANLAWVAWTVLRYTAMPRVPINKNKDQSL